MSGLSDPSESFVNRRHLVVGGGAALAAGAFLHAAAPAGAVPAAPSGPGGDGTRAARVHADGSPITTTIASAPVSGWTYRAVGMYDFRPFNPAAQPTWGGSGLYCAGTASSLRASVEIPAGALVRDVEYYVFNGGATTAVCNAYIYVPGNGYISSVGAQGSIPTGSGIQAVRAVLPAATWGPYPMGSRLMVGLESSSGTSIQINGARVGFSGGAGSVGLLESPVRAYDSRSSGGQIPAGGLRTITLPSTVVPPASAGVILNVTTFSARAGYLRVFSAAVSEPTTSSINYPSGNVAIANGMTVAVSSGRQLKVRSSQAAHVIVDVTGVIA